VKIQENIPLAPLTTLQVGGAARYFAELKREDELGEALHFATARDLPLFVLGGGSNLIVADSGWPGLVLKIALGGIATPKLQEPAGHSVLFSVGAGVNWDDFVAHAVSQNCAGIECLSGIPGSVGATPVQNVGAYGQEVADTIESVRAFDFKTPDQKENRIVVLPNPACGFRYRSSIFNSTERGRYIILRVNYRLKRGGAATVNYADLQKHFAESFPGRKTPPSLAEVRDAVRAIRQSKGMLIVPRDDKFPDTKSPDPKSPDNQSPDTEFPHNDSHSAGSFFKNPVLTEAEFKDLAARAASKALKIPSYPALDAHHKISAAWLVEHSGFSKGYVMGAAGISHKHALAIINRGNAKASDIIALKDEIQRAVLQAWGIQLEPEPVFIGFSQ
jgi:UDP-N-acetylmuramate dehydrogenase